MYRKPRSLSLRFCTAFTILLWNIGGAVRRQVPVSLRDFQIGKYLEYCCSIGIRMLAVFIRHSQHDITTEGTESD